MSKAARPLVVALERLPARARQAWYRAGETCSVVVHGSASIFAAATLGHGRHRRRRRRGRPRPACCVARHYNAATRGSTAIMLFDWPLPEISATFWRRTCQLSAKENIAPSRGRRWWYVFQAIINLPRNDFVWRCCSVAYSLVVPLSARM